MHSIDIDVQNNFHRGQNKFAIICFDQISSTNIDDWFNHDFTLLNVYHWFFHCDSCRSVVDLWFHRIVTHSGLFGFQFLIFCNLGQTANVKVCVISWCHGAGQCGFPFLTIQDAGLLSLFVTADALIIPHSNTTMTSEIGNFMLTNVLFKQPGCSCGSQAMVAVFPWNPSTVTKFSNNFGQCLSSHLLTAVPNVWVSWFCQWSQVEMVQAFWIIGWSLSDVLFKQTNNAPFGILQILICINNFGLVVQVLETSLIIFGLLFSVLEKTMTICIHFYLELWVSTSMQVLMFITCSQCKVETN